MNFLDEIFRKKRDREFSRSSNSSPTIRSISPNITVRRLDRTREDRENRPKATTSTSSAPKRPIKGDIVAEPEVVLRKRNPNTNAAAKKDSSRPISHHPIPNKTTSSRLKPAKSIPSLLEDSVDIRPITTRVRGKTGKDHHHQHHSHHSNQASLTTDSHGSGAATGNTAAPTVLPRTASASANLNVLALASDSGGGVGVREGKGLSARGKGGGGGGGGSKERLVDGGVLVAETVTARKGVSNRSKQVERPVSAESASELEQMQRQLQEMAAEKSSLMLQLEERLDQVSELQSEIKVLKIFQEQSVHQLDEKSEENAYLRTKLRDVVHSPLSDSEKQQLLLIDAHRHHSSAPASIAVNVPAETGDATACPTPDWDKHSSSNVSDVSVACLQDKINQMQETHYSTNEELQATLQELTDLQRQLTDLQVHNNRLGDEKNLMFDSLCRQTDRLKETRSELDSLKQHINTTQDNTEADTTQQYVEREAQLLDLVQQLEVERDNLRDRQQEIISEIQQLRISNEQGEEERSRLIERVRMLEGSVDAKVAEQRQIEQELSQIRDEFSGSKIEIDRLKDTLESARTKIVELEQDRDLSDKSELDELLDAARKEKDTLESEITHLREQVARSRNEIEKLREQVSVLQEECKVTRNNAKCTQSELDYKVETLISDKGNLIEQLQRLQVAVGDLEVQNQCQAEDKRQLSGVLSETQRNLSEAEEKLEEVVEELRELKKLRETENEEWEKFQNDLLTSVRVANDFKTEAQQDLQKIVLENKTYREKVRQLEVQIEKLKGSDFESSLIRSSIRRSMHVTPRKLEEGIILSKTADDIKLRNSSDSKAKSSKLKERKSSREKNEPVVVDLKKSSTDAVDIADTTVYTGVLAKPLIKAKPKVRRTKTLKLEKLLTEADEEKFRILGEMLAHIDQSVPVHLLSEEDRSLLKLKAFYDTREMYRHKPIAKKPKNELCVSNPLLNSVMANPALRKIAEDPNLPNVEPISPKLDLKESFSFARKQSRRYKLESSTMLEDGLPERQHKSYSTFKPTLHKSQSVNNLCERTYLTDSDEEASLKRYLTEEDLSRNFVIAPSDSKLSLNLWTGTYTFSNKPNHGRESESSYDSDLHVYTVNDDLNRSSSFMFESPAESLERRKQETTVEVKKDGSGKLRRFVGGLFGSRENLGVVHEARNSLFDNSKEVVEVQAMVHHSQDTIDRGTTSFIFYDIPKEDVDKPPRENPKETSDIRSERIRDQIETVSMKGISSRASKTEKEFVEDDVYHNLPPKNPASLPNQTKTSENHTTPIEGEAIYENLPAHRKKESSLSTDSFRSNVEMQEQTMYLDSEDEYSINETASPGTQNITDTTSKSTETDVAFVVDIIIPKIVVDLAHQSVSEDSVKNTNMDSMYQQTLSEKSSNLEILLDSSHQRSSSEDSVKGTNMDSIRKGSFDLSHQQISYEKSVGDINMDSNLKASLDSSHQRSASSEVSVRDTNMDSLNRYRSLAESLCRSDFTEEEIKLVQKVCETREESHSRAPSDINNDDIIVIEWIDYCDQCKDVGTIPLSLEEYSREIKSGRSISELDKLTRRSTEINEKAGVEVYLEEVQIVAKKQFLDAKCTAGFLDDNDLELIQNFAEDSAKKRASIKLDTLERKYSIKDDLDFLDPFSTDVEIRRSCSTQENLGSSNNPFNTNVRSSKVSRSSSEVDEPSRDSTEFPYVEDILNSWKFKTRRKMRSSITNAGFSISGPIPCETQEGLNSNRYHSLDSCEPVYQNAESFVFAVATTNRQFPETDNFIKSPVATPRELSTTSVNMTDKKQPEKPDEEDQEEPARALGKCKASFHIPTLENPNPPKETSTDSTSSEQTKPMANEIYNSPTGSKETTPPAKKTSFLRDYPSLERHAVSHVLNNNLPAFSKLKGKMSNNNNESGTSEEVEDRTKFQITSLRKDADQCPDNRTSFLLARNRFLQAEEDTKGGYVSPRTSLTKIEKNN